MGWVSLVPVVSFGFVAGVEAGSQAHNDQLAADFAAADGDAFADGECCCADDGGDEDEG